VNIVAALPLAHRAKLPSAGVSVTSTMPPALAVRATAIQMRDNSNLVLNIAISFYNAKIQNTMSFCKKNMKNLPTILGSETTFKMCRKRPATKGLLKGRK
jgi:hypothetical protein